MKRRELILCVAAALALTGCAGKKADEQTTSAVDTEAVTEEQTTEPQETQESEEETEEAVEEAEVFDYEGYNLVWSDEFDSFNREDWNVELHDPGWVNNELQAYIDSEENIYTEDGHLVIKPIKGTDEEGNVTYTSGRVNTQGLHDFTYGYFEASIKMPAGTGFLPAFWMMPTDENLYGQWPRCGEIDIAEVLGNATDTAYGTLHYGNPHSQSQGSLTLSDGDFTSEYHTYAVEWLPGEMNWYIDGVKIHSENDWYSATDGLGEITYPAPFDQPFYMILNLAVGGDWPGNPDGTTDFDTAEMDIDYVKVYQKDSYDENVTKPEKEVVLRDADESGNYIPNGDFAEDEDLTDTTDWEFLTAADGVGAAVIEDGVMKITTEKAGTEDYSIQLVSWDMPAEQGATYKVTFTAWSNEDRQGKVAVTAPERSWGRYLEDTSFDLTSEKTDYEFTFTMTEETDAEARLEFNMGNQGSTADFYLTNVRVEKTGENTEISTAKTVLSDGNYVYNAKFQEGTGRLGNWSLDGDAAYEVTNLADGRRLHITAEDGQSLTVSQTDLALTKDSEYLLTFDTEGTGSVSVTINGATETFDLGDAASQSYKFTYTDGADLTFTLTGPAELYLDNVRIVENVMIKNGSFNAGTSGYEVYVDSSAKASYVVDALSEDNAMDFTIDATGDADWKIQLKQNNVKLEMGKTYTLTFDAKSDMDREIRVIMQGGEALGWPAYGEITASLTGDYQTYTTTFTMEADTDAEAFLSVCLGAVNGKSINEQHRVCIDNISLVED